MSDLSLDRAYAYLDRNSTEFGTFEHAKLDVPRREHGFCTDDMARVLVATSDAAAPRTAATARLGALALSFLIDAPLDDGSVRNRRDAAGTWERASHVGDCWGRLLWGLGSFVASKPNGAQTQLALSTFAASAPRRAPWRRSMAFAALGAALVLDVDPEDETARSLLEAATGSVIARTEPCAWTWPEDTLSYANALLPHAMLVAGRGLSDEALVTAGLSLLEWLVRHETGYDRYSVTSTAGASATRNSPRFDQQPIEIATLADACAAAHSITNDDTWSSRVLMAAEWFDGRNDLAISMIDPVSGGCYDGLCADGPNRNQGAESTLALITTLQCAQRVGGGR